MLRIQWILTCSPHAGEEFKISTFRLCNVLNLIDTVIRQML